MMLRFFVEVVGEFDSKELWQSIKEEGVNVLDMGEEVWVYGSVQHQRLGDLLYNCCLFGDLHNGIIILA